MAKKIICSCNNCKKTKIKQEFYVYNSMLYGDYFPLCKSCITQLYRDLVDNGYKNPILSVIHIANLMNLNFEGTDIRDWQNMVDRKGDIAILDVINYLVGELKRRKADIYNQGSLTSVRKYIENIESIASNRAIEEYEKENESIDDDIEITQEMLTRWGSEFNPKDMVFLDAKYKSLARAYGGTTPMAHALYERFAINELGMRQALEKGDDATYIKYQNAQSKLMADGNLKPKRDDEGDSDKALIGMIIKTIEEERPIPEPSEKFKDVDGIKKIIQEEFVNTLARSIGANLK